MGSHTSWYIKITIFCVKLVCYTIHNKILQTAVVTHTQTYFDQLLSSIFLLVSYFKAIEHMHVNIDTPGHPGWISFVQRIGLICSAAHHFGATTFGLFWIISFEFVKVFWACFSSWERFIGFLADASLRGRRKKGKGRGWGRVKSAKKGKRISPSFFPFLPIPYPFRRLLHRLADA